MTLDRFLLKKILLCLIAFFSYFLGIILNVSAIGIFLDTIGSKGVPVILTVASAMAIVYSLLNSYLSARISPARFFYSTVLLVAALLALVFFGVSNGRWFAITLFLLANFLNAFFDVMVTNFSYSLVSPLQGKSVIPLTKGFSAFGEMAGSVFASYLWIRSGEHVWTTVILLALAGLAMVVGVTGSLFAKRKPESKDEGERGSESGFKRMLESVGFVFGESKLFLYVALCMVLISFLITFGEFKFLTTLNASFTGGNLSRMLGQSYGLMNGLYLILSLFVVRWVLFRAGVANTILSYPLINLGMFAVMLGSGLNVISVVGMYLLITVLYSSVVSVTLTQILALAPDRINQSVYLLIKGVIRYTAALLASLCLLVYSFDLGLEKFLNTFLIGTLLVLLVFVIVRLRKEYLNSLKINLQSGDEDLKLKSIDLLAEKINRGKAERYLRRLLVSEISSEKVRLRTIASLGVIGNLDSIIDLIGVLKNGTAREKYAAVENINAIVRTPKRLRMVPLTRHTLLSVYEELLVGRDPVFVKRIVVTSLKFFEIEEVIKFLDRQLHSDNLSIRLNAISTLGAFRDRGVVAYLRPLLDSDSQTVVREVIHELWKFEDLRMVLLPRMVEIFSGKSVESVKNSLILIGKLRISWERRLVEENLDHEDPSVRALAVLAMIDLGETKFLKSLVPLILEFEHNPEQLDYLLSEYKKFSDANKKRFLGSAQELDESTIDGLRGIFQRSVYSFEREVEALNAARAKSEYRIPLPGAAKTAT
jgi:MFS family permease